MVVSQRVFVGKSRQSVDDGVDDLSNRSSGEVLLRPMNLATGHVQTSDRNPGEIITTSLRPHYNHS